MKSLFKKNSPNPNDSHQKNPELPKASTEEARADQSITSFFKDLARKTTSTKQSATSTKLTDDILVKKNSNERKVDNSRKDSPVGPKTGDLNKDISIDPKWMDLGSRDFDCKNLIDSRSDLAGSKDSINSSLKMRKSTIKRTNSEIAERSAQKSGTVQLLRRPTLTKEFSDSTDSISGTRSSATKATQESGTASLLRRQTLAKEVSDSTDSISGTRSSATKDSLKARLELQRQELSMNFGSAINSGAPISKVKLKETVLKSGSSGRLDGGNNGEVVKDNRNSDAEIADSLNSSRREIVRDRWIFAIQMVIRGLKSTSLMSKRPNDMEIIDAIKKAVIDDPQSLNAISGIIKIPTTAKTDNQKAKIISLLRKPAFYRGPEQANALDVVLKTLPAFSRYSKSFRMKLIEKGTLVDLQPYRVVIRQGGVPMALYFLLSGKCVSETIVVKNGKGYIRRANISPGEAFGEFGMGLEEKRRYTVHTIVQSVVFSVPRETYIQMMKEEVMINRSEKLEFLRSIPAFHTLSSTILEALLSCCHVFGYEPSMPLLKVGDRDNVFFVLDGQCRANRLVPFLVKTQTQVPSLTPEITGAYVPGVQLGPNESVVYYNMSIGLLGPGNFFPRISLLRHEGLQYHMRKFDVAKIIVLLNSILKHKPQDEPRADRTNIAAIFNKALSEDADDLEDMIAGVDLSVTAIDKMTCLVISKMDLVKILSEDVLRDLTSNDAEGLMGFSMAEIQQNYFDKIEWKGFGEEVVNSVVEKKQLSK